MVNFDVGLVGSIIQELFGKFRAGFVWNRVPLCVSVYVCLYIQRNLQRASLFKFL